MTLVNIEKMMKVWNRKFQTNSNQRRCPIRTFSRQPTHEYPIHEKYGAVLVSLNSHDGIVEADEGAQNLPEIESCQKDQDEGQRKQKFSLNTIRVIQAQSILQDVDKGANVVNDAVANDVDDNFLPREKNLNLQTLDIPTYKKAAASMEPEKKKDTDNHDTRTHETRTIPLVAKKSVNKGIFSWKKIGVNQNGKKKGPLNQHQEEKRGKECWGYMHKDPSKTDNAVNKPLNNNTKGVSNKISFWKRKKKNPIGKNVVHTEQEQGNKDGGHVLEVAGDSSLIKEGIEITATTTTPKSANVADGDAILDKEVAESTTTTAHILANLTNVQSYKSMELISHSNNGIHIYNNCQFHFHNHGSESHHNKTYNNVYQAPNGIISTGKSSDNMVNNNGMMDTGNRSNNTVSNNGMMNTGNSSNKTVNNNDMMDTGNSLDNTVNNNDMMNTGNSLDNSQ